MRISSAEGERQIYPTVPPVDPTIATPFGTSIPSVTPIPTLGPGQYYEGGDRIPDVIQPELLDEPFGYSEILGKPGLYLVWSTSDVGKKHFYILDESSKYFTLIVEAVDDYQTRVFDLKASAPGKRFLVGAGGVVVFSTISAVCGGGAIVAGALQHWEITAAGVACDGIYIPLSFESGRIAFEGAVDFFAVYKFQESKRNMIEGYFSNIPYEYP